MTQQPTAVGAALDLAGATSLHAAGSKPVVPDGDGLIVVREGTVDAFFVPIDDEGRPRLPEFVKQLSGGDAVVRGWWRDASLGLPAGRGVLRAVGEAGLVQVPAAGDLPEPLQQAAARWTQAVQAFASGRTADGDGAAAVLEKRRELDEKLGGEGERALLRVFEFEQVARRPPGLSPLASALADAADATGAPAEPGRLEALAQGTHTQDAVQEIAALLRIPIRAVTLDGDWWTEGSQPLVVFGPDGPAALVPWRRGHALRDAAGRWARLDAGAAASIQPGAYAVYPRLPDRAVTPRDMARLGFHGGRRLIATLGAMTAVVAAFGFFLPYATTQIVSVIVPSGSEDALAAMLVALAAFTIASLAATVVLSLAVLALSSRAATGLTASMWDRLLHAPPSFFRGRSSGELARQVTAVDQMRELIGGSLVAGLAGSALAVAAIVLLFGYATMIALVVIPIFLLSLAVAAFIVLRQERYLQTTVDARNRLNGLLLGFFSGISKLRVAGAERRAHALWQRGYAFQQEAQRNASLQAVRLAVLQGLLSGLFLFGVVFAAAFLESGQTSLVDFTGSVAASGQLAGAAGSMIAVAMTIVHLPPLYRSALPILETAPEITAGAPVPEDFAGEIRLDRIRFGYDEGSVILDDITFEVKPGSFVAIAGPSGAGKTTILRIVLGFEEPWEGEVLLDGKPIDTLDLEAVRRRMGTVIQGARITSGTILTTIVGTLALGQEAAWEAAELAGIADDIRAMPMQMSTMVPEGGSGFSGGQLQRLLLASALVRKPKILLLDEATSALDNETQKTVMDHLGRLGITRLVIAHRLSTVVHADHIVVVERGKVVEDGPYAALIENGGLFASLARRQLL